jgi:uncharacterized OB-fold protein
MSDQSWIPEPSAETKPFFDGASEGKLRLQVCTHCDTWAYPLTTICSHCGSTEIVWRDASGKGNVYAHARLQRPYHARHAERLPLILAQIDIDEGLRLYSNVVDIDGADLKVGAAVEVAFEKFDDGGVLPVFKPLST